MDLTNLADKFFSFTQQLILLDLDLVWIHIFFGLCLHNRPLEQRGCLD
jgi:hypothetical protein